MIEMPISDSDGATGLPDSPGESDHDDAHKGSRQTKESFFLRPGWRFCGMPLMTNMLSFVIVSTIVTLVIKHIEFDDKVKSVGISAHVEIIKSDYTQLRGLAVTLRRMSRGIDNVVLARARGTAPPRTPDEALRTLADLDDALYYIRIVDDRSDTKSEAEKEYNLVVGEARTLIQAVHDCLAPAVVSNEVRGICAGVAEKYRVSPANEPSPALALHLVDNAVLAVRKQLNP
jgi:hypothetical protein